MASATPPTRARKSSMAAGTVPHTQCVPYGIDRVYVGNDGAAGLFAISAGFYRGCGQSLSHVFARPSNDAIVCMKFRVSMGLDR